MRKFLAAALAAMLLLGGFAYVHYFSKGEEALFDVKDGDTGAKIASRLQEQGIISSPLWFKLVLRASRSARKIRPGRYTLYKDISSEEALWRLLHTKGAVYIKVSIPEGWRCEQIAERLAEAGITDKNAFIQLVKDKDLEGYLFPSTYFWEANTPPEQVAELMKKEFENKVRPLFAEKAPLGLGEKEVLAIASIIEREAVVASERPLIAAVYLNRVKKRMALEADPTVQYAVGYDEREGTWWKKGLTRKDLKINSLYNTYKYAGLPPGPICNPGYDSIRAVFSPAPINALYFVADGTGQHVFNASFDEHKKAKTRAAKAAKAAAAAQPISSGKFRK